MKFLLSVTQLLSLFLITQIVSAQSISSDVIANSGENFVAGNVSLDWTLGESVTDVLTAYPYIDTQGFHQTFLTAAKANVLTTDYSSVKVYPNPARDFVHIFMKNISGKVNIELYDMSGKKLHEEKINALEDYKLNLKKFADGKYLLNVITDHPTTYGIIKSSK